MQLHLNSLTSVKPSVATDAFVRLDIDVLSRRNLQPIEPAAFAQILTGIVPSAVFHIVAKPIDLGLIGIEHDRWTVFLIDQDEFAGSGVAMRYCRLSTLQHDGPAIIEHSALFYRFDSCDHDWRLAGDGGRKTCAKCKRSFVPKPAEAL